MADQIYIVEDIEHKKVTVLVRRDKRLKKSSRWTWQTDGSVLLRIPSKFPKQHIGILLDQVSTQLHKKSKMAERRTDAELQLRAEQINKKYFGGRFQWRAIRWVGNMEQRLGSCTTGGTTVGHIRISDKIKNWPAWVVDYVIAHELVHLVHNDHSQAFWDMLKEGYPLGERARGFIKGVGFKEGKDYYEED